MQVHANVGAGGTNDLLDRLAAHPAFRAVPAAALKAELDPVRYTGRSEAQVQEFVQEMLQPILVRAGALAASADSVEVRV
jgi:adenylosuccinate lyase